LSTADKLSSQLFFNSNKTAPAFWASFRFRQSKQQHHITSKKTDQYHLIAISISISCTLLNNTTDL